MIANMSQGIILFDSVDYRFEFKNQNSESRSQIGNQNNQKIESISRFWTQKSEYQINIGNKLINIVNKVVKFGLLKNEFQTNIMTQMTLKSESIIVKYESGNHFI